MLNKYLREEGSKEGREALNKVVMQASPALAWPSPLFPVALVIKRCPSPPISCRPCSAPPLSLSGVPMSLQTRPFSLQQHTGFSLIAFTQLD